MHGGGWEDAVAIEFHISHFFGKCGMEWYCVTVCVLCVCCVCVLCVCSVCVLYVCVVCVVCVCMCVCV